MSKFGSKWTFRWNPDPALRITERMMEQLLNRVCILSVAEIRQNMSLPKHGENMGPVTRRSAPGESPAVQYGILFNAITFDTPLKLMRRVGVASIAFYGKYLEPGTDQGIRNRPFLKQRVKSVFNREVTAFIKKRGKV